MYSRLLQDLKFAISLKRPHLGTGVTQLCDYILKRTKKFEPSVDYAGNIHIDNRGSEKHTTLFTAHVDTVHKSDGINEFTISGNLVKAKDDVLGADDGAGVALLLHLLDNDVKAYYIFFQGEERGGVGSGWLAENRRLLLKQFDIAVAFDRKSTYSIITEQMCGQTASDEFATALASQLNDKDETFMYVPDDTGIYTDTAEFEDIIPECTNISVGYNNEHTTSESLDLNHFKRLSKAIVKIDWDALPVARDPQNPKVKEYKGPTSYYTKKEDYYLPDYFEPVGSMYSDKVTYLEREEELFYALKDAKNGSKKDLLLLLAEYVMPDEKEMALSYANSSKLDNNVIDVAIKMIYEQANIDEVIDFLFDHVYQDHQ